MFPNVYNSNDVAEWANWSVFERGLDYEDALSGLNLRVQNEAVHIHARVQGSARNAYDVTVRWDGKKLAAWCDCPYGYVCKHAVAVAIAGMDEVHAMIHHPETPTWQVALEVFRRIPVATATAAPTPFTYRLKMMSGLGRRDHKTLCLSVGTGRGTDFKPILFRDARVRRTGSSLDRLILASLDNYVAYSYQGGSDPHWHDVRAPYVDAALRLLVATPNIEDETGQPLAIMPDAPITSSLVYERNEHGAVLQPNLIAGSQSFASPAPLKVLGDEPSWVWLDNGLYPFSGSPDVLSRVNEPIVIPASEVSDFETRYLPDLAIAGRVTGANIPAIKKGKPIAQLLLEEHDGVLHGRLGFVYGGIRVEADDTVNCVGAPGGQWLSRSKTAERRWLEQLQLPPRRGAKGKPEFANAFSLKGEVALDFVYERVPELIEAGFEVMGEDQLTQLSVHRSKATTRVSITSGIDWLDVNSAVTVGDDVVPWPEVLAALAKKRRYVRLGSGQMARLPQDWLETQLPLLQALGLNAKGVREGKVRVQRYQAPLLERLLANADVVQADDSWNEFIHKFKTFGGISEVALPTGFTGELRPYQQQGLNFMTFLRDYGLHGILADDMGLGKTVQAAALLTASHPNPSGPSLVIAPTSVILNWQKELERFAPKLKTLVLHGNRRDVEAIDAHDVVITTYTTARFDLATHLKRHYHILILDEAQAIKNPKSQTAEVVRALKCRHRLCLTGTPIENNLMELWSQFNFLMPGMLGKENEFRSNYVSAIATGNKHVADALKTRISPFILRRMKSEVAQDLPPRTDVPVWCELSASERRLYNTLLVASRARVMAAVNEKGVNQSHITILDALLKLRQVCCHPALLGMPETLHLPSAKTDAFMELVRELVANGHRALVFSQFTSMLAILRERLEQGGIGYEYLDGATKNRQAKVDRFNQGDTPLFLISLKAGGTGLNLTGADYVIHFDPWWNPAVEDQATDRAHRIGQTRHVFNYKLLAKGTIEEKLLKLQERKRALVRDILDADTLGKQLTLEDLRFLFTDDVSSDAALP